VLSTKHEKKRNQTNSFPNELNTRTSRTSHITTSRPKNRQRLSVSFTVSSSPSSTLPTYFLATITIAFSFLQRYQSSARAWEPADVDDSVLPALFDDLFSALLLLLYYPLAYLVEKKLGAFYFSARGGDMLWSKMVVEEVKVLGRHVHKIIPIVR